MSPETLNQIIDLELDDRSHMIDTVHMAHVRMAKQ